jgi:hypothetical protein
VSGCHQRVRFSLFRTIGYKSIGAPVAFGCFKTNNIPIQKAIEHAVQIIIVGILYGFCPTVCYQGGNLQENKVLFA